jgi:hypothetical protein
MSAIVGPCLHACCEYCAWWFPFVINRSGAHFGGIQPESQQHMVFLSMCAFIVIVVLVQKLPRLDDSVLRNVDMEIPVGATCNTVC